MRQSFSPPVLETRSAEPAVALREVTKVYGSGGGAVTALHEVTADFAAGSFTAVMGPSGSGKSTLLQCAAGLDRPTSGEVRLAGQSLRGLSETKLTRLRRDRIGFVFQSFNLLPSLTAELNVALPLRLAGRKPARGEVRDMLAVVGLADGDPDQWTGQYVSGPALSAVTRFPVVAGSLSNLTGTGTVAVPAGSWRLGQTASLWLDDSAPVRLRVVAVLAGQIDTEQTVLLPWALRGAHTATPLASAVYLRLAPGARLAPVRAAAAAGGGTLSRTAAYLTASDAQSNHANTLALIAILGMALIYTGIAIANTLVMATATRNRELAALRLSGALPRQVLGMIGVEALVVSGIGVLFAAAVTAVTVLGLRHGLAPFAPSVRLVVPWLPLSGIALACLVVALLASLIPAAIALRRPPLELAGAQE